MSIMFIGAVLEGAPALIIFGLLLTPIATQLGIDPLRNVVKPTTKYLAVLFASLMRPVFVLVFVSVFVPAFSLWLPRQPGL